MDKYTHKIDFPRYAMVCGIKIGIDPFWGSASYWKYVDCPDCWKNKKTIDSMKVAVANYKFALNKEK